MEATCDNCDGLMMIGPTLWQMYKASQSTLPKLCMTCIAILSEGKDIALLNMTNKKPGE